MSVELYTVVKVTGSKWYLVYLAEKIKDNTGRWIRTCLGLNVIYTEKQIEWVGK